MTPLEKDIEKALGRMVGRHGGLCRKWVCPGWAGVPDRIVLMPHGRIYFVELKRPDGGTRSALQQWWADKLTELGFPHWWILTANDVKCFETRIIKDQGPFKGWMDER